MTGWGAAGIKATVGNMDRPWLAEGARYVTDQLPRLLDYEVEALRDPVWTREFVLDLEEAFPEVFPELEAPLPDPVDDWVDPNPLAPGYLDTRWRDQVVAAVKARLGDVKVRVDVLGPFIGRAAGNPVDRVWNGRWDGNRERPLRVQILTTSPESDPTAGVPSAPIPRNGSVWMLRGPHGGDRVRCTVVYAHFPGLSRNLMVELLTDAGERFALPFEKFIEETGQLEAALAEAGITGPIPTVVTGIERMGRGDSPETPALGEGIGLLVRGVKRGELKDRIEAGEELAAVRLPSKPQLFSCPLCSAAVVDPIAHEAWHHTVIAEMVRLSRACGRVG